MSPALSNVSVYKDHNLRIGGDRVVPVGGENDDLRLSELSKELEDRALSLGIQARYRLVQDDHRGVLIKEPGQCQALPLPTREVSLSSKSRSDKGIEAVRQPFYYFA